MAIFEKAVPLHTSDTQSFDAGARTFFHATRKETVPAPRGARAVSVSDARGCVADGVRLGELVVDSVVCGVRVALPV